MRKTIEDFLDDAETIKSFRFRSFWLKKPSAQKYISNKSLSKFEHCFVSGLSSVRHVLYVCISEIGIEPINSKI
jgi:hypothetical protein